MFGEISAFNAFKVSKEEDEESKWEKPEWKAKCQVDKTSVWYMYPFDKGVSQRMPNKSYYKMYGQSYRWEYAEFETWIEVLHKNYGAFAIMEFPWECVLIWTTNKKVLSTDDKAMLHERNETSAREDSHLEEDPPPAYGDIYR